MYARLNHRIWQFISLVIGTLLAFIHYDGVDIGNMFQSREIYVLLN